MWISRVSSTAIVDKHLSFLLFGKSKLILPHYFVSTLLWVLPSSNSSILFLRDNSSGILPFLSFLFVILKTHTFYKYSATHLVYYYSVKRKYLCQHFEIIFLIVLKVVWIFSSFWMIEFVFVDFVKSDHILDYFLKLWQIHLPLGNFKLLYLKTLLWGFPIWTSWYLFRDSTRVFVLLRKIQIHLTLEIAFFTN